MPQYCRLVTTHHTIEDQALFPAAPATETPDLVPVVDRLQYEHEIIHEVLEGVDQALVAFVGPHDDPAGLRLDRPADRCPPLPLLVRGARAVDPLLDWRIRRSSPPGWSSVSLWGYLERVAVGVEQLGHSLTPGHIGGASQHRCPKGP